MQHPIVQLEVLPIQGNENHAAGFAAASIRTVHLKQQSNYEGYGFTLNQRNVMASQVIVSNLEQGSPADTAGLREGDAIIEVNGYNIKECSNAEVATMVRSSHSSITLLVIDANAAVAIDTYNATVFEQPDLDADDIKGYISLAFCVTFCCCWPLGLVALFLACQSRSNKEEGNYELAKRESQCSLGCSIGGIISGIVTIIVLIILKIGFSLY